MIPIFYASIALVATAVLGLVAGAIGGIRIWSRYTGAMARVWDNDKYRNTSGAIWMLNQVHGQLQGGTTLEDLTKWVDAQGDELAARFQNTEAARDVIDEMDRQESVEQDLKAERKRVGEPVYFPRDLHCATCGSVTRGHSVLAFVTDVAELPPRWRVDDDLNRVAVCASTACIDVLCEEVEANPPQTRDRRDP